MKRIVTLLLGIILCMSLSACRSTYDRIDAEQIKAYGFVTIEQLGTYGEGASYVVYDPTTKVEYIAITGIYGNFSFCPYYDEDGDVAIYEEVK